MSLQIVAGKPGSGKSYHTVTMLLQHLEDWAVYQLKEGKSFERVLYTNLPLQVETINAYLSRKIGEDVEVFDYIRPIDENVREQFRQSLGKFPLATLPGNSFIVIDEVQKMFGAEMETDKKNQNFNVQFRNYISQHRHYGHDLIFITQHTDNIAKGILAMADKLYQVENAKHLGLPFPFNIPFSDLDVVKEAFGIKNQFYRVSIGKYQGRRVKFDGEMTSHLMTQEIFDCYQSHTLSDVTSDRPSLNLSRLGSLLWLAKKHAWHLSLKLVVFVLLMYWGLYIITQLPSIMAKSAGVSAVKSSDVTAPVSSENVSIPKMSPTVPLPALPPVFNPANNLHMLPNGMPPMPEISSCGTPGCTHDHSLPPLKKDEKITAVFMQGVITDNGRRRIGQPVMIDGVEETIQSTNVRNGVVMFASGKAVTVPK
jgi:zona occludens toxin (predicted ATPase)